MNKKKKIMIGTGCVVLLVALGSGAYYVSVENHKKEVMNKMDLIFTKTKEIEYGTQEFDIQSLIQEVKDAEIKQYPTLDVMSVGEQTLTFTLTQEGLEKTIEHKVTVTDTQLPEIKFKKDKLEITVGDKFDAKKNIESVKDVVDGDLKLVEKLEEEKGVYAIEGKVDTKKAETTKLK